MNISRAFVQRYLISYSCSWTGLPGRLPRTGCKSSVNTCFVTYYGRSILEMQGGYERFCGHVHPIFFSKVACCGGHAAPHFTHACEWAPRCTSPPQTLTGYVPSFHRPAPQGPKSALQGAYESEHEPLTLQQAVNNRVQIDLRLRICHDWSN